MIDFGLTTLEGLTVHFVGNKLREEGLFISQEPVTDLNEDEVQLLLKFFLRSFNTEELYRFTHPSDLQLNEVYSYAAKLFENSNAFAKQSKNLANYLYNSSTHTKVKAGEFFVVYFGNCVIDNENVDAIGLFKTENKEKYLDAIVKKEAYQLRFHEGIPLGKVEKGCLILNKSAEEGFTVCVIDTKTSDAQYWTNEFLQVTPQSNSFHQTKTYLKICQEFVTNELPQVVDMVTKADQIDLMNRSVEYFKSNTELNTENFTEEIFEEPEVRQSFKHFKKEYERDNDIEVDDFEISTKAVKRQAQVFKSVLKLDKNFHIYIHGDKQLIEKGFDEETGKHFYKIYFDNEM